MVMGYGGIQGKVMCMQLFNDGGIDGIIDQDVLGLLCIYVQVKWYGLDKSIGWLDIQGFVGVLQGVQVDCGVFLIMVKFFVSVQEYVDVVVLCVVLIDGDRLVELMICYGVGVQVKRIVVLVEVDEDYFE